MKYDYKKEIQNSRLCDVDGDLSYTIHINKVEEICKKIVDVYSKEIDKLKKVNYP